LPYEPASLRHLGRGHEIELLVAGELEQVLFEFRELTRTAKRVGVDDERREDLDVALLTVNVEHECHERAIQSRGGAVEDGETRAGDLRRAIEVENAEGFPDVPVRLGREVERRSGSPRSLDAIRRLVTADRNGLVGDVREVQLEIAEILLDGGKAIIELLDLVADALHRIDLRGRVLPALLERGDLLRCHVALVLQGLHAGDGAAAVRLQLQEAVEVDVHAAVLQRLTILLCVLAQIFTGQHGRE
jgi:hypothetical protein